MNPSNKPTMVSVQDVDVLQGNLLGQNLPDDRYNPTQFTITLARGGVLGTAEGFPEGQMQENLVAHELAHNLTWMGYNYTDSVGESQAKRDFAYFGVIAGQYAYSTSDRRNSRPDWPWELTADAIGSWVLGYFVDDVGDAVAGRIGDFMSTQIQQALQVEQ